MCRLRLPSLDAFRLLASLMHDWFIILIQDVPLPEFIPTYPTYPTYSLCRDEDCSAHNRLNGRLVTITHADQFRFSGTCCTVLSFRLVDRHCNQYTATESHDSLHQCAISYRCVPQKMRPRSSTCYSFHPSRVLYCTNGRKIVSRKCRITRPNLILVVINIRRGDCTLVHRNATAVYRSGLARFERNNRVLRHFDETRLSSLSAYSLTAPSFTPLNRCVAAGVTDAPHRPSICYPLNWGSVLCNRTYYYRTWLFLSRSSLLSCPSNHASALGWRL